MTDHDNVPEGRLGRHSIVPPGRSGTMNTPPTVETVGYFHPSLRDEDGVFLQFFYKKAVGSFQRHNPLPGHDLKDQAVQIVVSQGDLFFGFYYGH